MRWAQQNALGKVFALDAPVGNLFMSQQLLRPTRANTILSCHNWAATAAFYRRLAFPDVFENDWFVESHLSGDAYLSVAAAGRASVAADAASAGEAPP